MFDNVRHDLDKALKRFALPGRRRPRLKPDFRNDERLGSDGCECFRCSAKN